MTRGNRQRDDFPAGGGLRVVDAVCMRFAGAMKLLLIGHGYLGQAVARVFRAADWQVVAVSLTGGDGVMACDVADRAAVSQLPMADAIVHCAASGRGGADAYQRVYVDGCRNLTQSFAGVPMLFTSSSSVYAQTDGSVVTEESPTLPERETGCLLLESERIVLAAGGVVARLSGIYGPQRSVILKKFLTGDAVIEDDGQRIINQIHRDDAARAIWHLIDRRAAGVFNVSDSTPMAQRECYQHLAKLFNRPLPPSGPRDPNRKRGWTHKQVSNAKLLGSGLQLEFPSFVQAAEAIATTL